MLRWRRLTAVAAAVLSIAVLGGCTSDGVDVDPAAVEVIGDEVFVGDELTWLIPSADAVGEALGRSVQWEGVRSAFDPARNLPASDSGQSCASAAGILPLRQVAGWRGDSAMLGEELVFQLGAVQVTTIALATAAFDDLAASLAAGCDGNVEATVYDSTLRLEPDEDMPAMAGVSASGNGANLLQVWVAVRVQNAVVFAMADQPGGTKAADPAVVAGLIEAIRETGRDARQRVTAVIAAEGGVPVPPSPSASAAASSPAADATTVVAFANGRGSVTIPASWSGVVSASEGSDGPAWMVERIDVTDEAGLEVFSVAVIPSGAQWGIGGPCNEGSPQSPVDERQGPRGGVIPSTRLFMISAGYVVVTPSPWSVAQDENCLGYPFELVDGGSMWVRTFDWSPDVGIAAPEQLILTDRYRQLVTALATIEFD